MKQLFIVLGVVALVGAVAGSVYFLLPKKAGNINMGDGAPIGDQVLPQPAPLTPPPPELNVLPPATVTPSPTPSTQPSSTKTPPAPAPSPVPAPSPAPVPAPSPSPTPPPPSSALPVQITNFSFSPATITVHKGTTVTWTNKDSAGHTVTGDSGGPNSSLLTQNQVYSYVFNTLGTFPYHCSPHPFMKGTVTVIE